MLIHILPKLVQYLNESGFTVNPSFLNDFFTAYNLAEIKTTELDELEWMIKPMVVKSQYENQFFHEVFSGFKSRLQMEERTEKENAQKIRKSQKRLNEAQKNLDKLYQRNNSLQEKLANSVEDTQEYEPHKKYISKENYE